MLSAGPWRACLCPWPSMSPTRSSPYTLLPGLSRSHSAVSTSPEEIALESQYDCVPLLHASIWGLPWALRIKSEFLVWHLRFSEIGSLLILTLNTLSGLLRDVMLLSPAPFRHVSRLPNACSTFISHLKPHWLLENAFDLLGPPWALLHSCALWASRQNNT